MVRLNINPITILLIVAITAMSACASSRPPSSSSSITPGSGDTEVSLKHDGIIRKYNVHLPPSYDKRIAHPLVIYLHGGGGSIKAAYKDGADKAADKFGFVLVVPAGTGPIPDRLLTWNGGVWKTGSKTEKCCGYAAENNVDDVGFISAMIDAVSTQYAIDKSRVYATGISNGGLMSYRLACELAEKITAVAAVAPPAMPALCSSSRPVSIMHIHGTADPCAPYDGGTGGGCLGARKYEMQSATEMVDRWKSINSCSSNTAIGYEKGNTVCLNGGPCSMGTEVTFCTIKGGGHTWPSGSQYLPSYMIGPVSYDISTDFILEFFINHPSRLLKNIPPPTVDSSIPSISRPSRQSPG